MPSRQHRLRKNTTLPRAYLDLVALAPRLQDRIYAYFKPLGHLDGANDMMAALLREAGYRVIGVGGVRVVVDVGDGFAAKVAVDAYGDQQNRAEAAFWRAHPLPDLMPVHAFSQDGPIKKDGTVLLTERAETPVSEAEAEAAAARLDKHPQGRLIGETYYPFQWGRHRGRVKLLDYGDNPLRPNPAPRLRRNNVTAAPQTDTAAFKKWFGKSKVVDAEGKPLVVYHGTMGGGFVEFDLGKIDKHHSGFFFTNSKEVAESYGMGNPLPRRVCAVPDIRTVADVRRFVKSPENAFENGWRIVLNESRQVIEEDESDDLPYTGMGARVFTSFSPFWERNGKTEDIGEDYYYPPYSDLVSDIRQALRRGGPLTSGTYAVYLRMLKPMVVDGRGAAWMSIPYKGGYYKTNQLSAIAKEKGHDGLILRNIYDSSIVQDVISDVYVVFDSRNIKSATANVGTFDRKDADIRKNPRRNPRIAPTPDHPQMETPAFKRWFGKSKVVDADGKPIRVYHGTFGDFSVFNFGRSVGLNRLGFWFDAGANIPNVFAGGREIPRFAGGSVMPVYLSLQNPKEYWSDPLTSEEYSTLDVLMWLKSRDADGEDFPELPLEILIRRDAKKLRMRPAGLANVSLRFSNVLEYLRIRGWRDAFTKMLRDLLPETETSEGRVRLLDDPSRVDAVRERLAKQHDGIILHSTLADAAVLPHIYWDHPDAYRVRETNSEMRHFGSDWYLALDPRQIKSATGNAGTFDPADPDIRKNPRRRVSR